MAIEPSLAIERSDRSGQLGAGDDLSRCAKCEPAHCPEGFGGPPKRCSGRVESSLLAPAACAPLICGRNSPRRYTDRSTSTGKVLQQPLASPLPTPLPTPLTSQVSRTQMTMRRLSRETPNRCRITLATIKKEEKVARYIGGGNTDERDEDEAKEHEGEEHASEEDGSRSDDDNGEGNSQERGSAEGLANIGLLPLYIQVLRASQRLQKRASNPGT